MRGVRYFDCKRCGKRTHDQWANAPYFSEKHQIMIHQENLDLCKKCFKKTRKEQSQTMAVKEAMEKGLLKEDDLSKIQDDPNFKAQLFEKLNKLIVEGVRKRNNELKNIGISPSDKRRKESRKTLQGIRALEQQKLNDLDGVHY